MAWFWEIGEGSGHGVAALGGDAVSFEALEEDAAGAGEVGHEEAFAGEEDLFDASGGLDVVVDALGEGSEVAGAHDGGFTRVEDLFDEVAGAVDEDGALSGDLLEEESGATEEGGSGASGDGDIDIDLGAEGGDEGPAGGNDWAVGKVPGEDFSGLIGAEGDLLVGPRAGDVGEA